MRCSKCNAIIYYKGVGRPPQYCKDCAYYVDLEQGRLRHRLYRKYKQELGTRNFEAAMQRNKDNTPDFKAELRQVRKELRDLGVRRNGNTRKTQM